MPPSRRKDERRGINFDDVEANDSINVYDLDAALYGKIAETAGPLIKLVDGNIKTQGFTLTPTGLQVSEKVNADNWTQLGHLLFRLEGSIQWLIGDWLAYGMDLEWGDIPKIAQDLGRDERLLHRYKQMATRFNYARRRVELTFGHHESVRSLSDEDQDYALSQAVEHGMSVADFRKWLKGASPAQMSEQTGADIAIGEPEALTSAAWTIDQLEQWDARKASAQERAAALAYIQQQRQRWESLEERWRSR